MQMVCCDGKLIKQKADPQHERRWHQRINNPDKAQHKHHDNEYPDYNRHAAQLSRFLLARHNTAPNGPSPTRRESEFLVHAELAQTIWLLAGFVPSKPHNLLCRFPPSRGQKLAIHKPYLMHLVSAANVSDRSFSDHIMSM